jgi:hypothetical protein
VKYNAAPAGRVCVTLGQAVGEGTLIGVPAVAPPMSDPLVVDAGEYDTEELLRRLEEGQRVVVRTEFLDSEHEVTLRHDGETYYCDTPTTLHKHENAEEMRECLETQGYSRE